MVKLYAMTQKGYEVLNELITNGYSSLIICVVSSRDKGLEKDFYNEIKSLCLNQRIRFFDKADNCNVISDYTIAVSWRWIIEEVKNLIVLHDSILPKYRGFAPLVSSLKNGEEEIGVTALYASSEYDRGEVICSFKSHIEYPIKIADAIELVSGCYKECINYIFSVIANGGTLHSVKQDDSQATYSLWLNEEDYRIDWNRDSEYIERFVNAVGWPYAGAYTNAGNEVIKIVEVNTIADVAIENRTPGKVIFVSEGCPVVVCGVGLLKIKMAVTSTGKDFLPLKRFRTKFV